MFGGRRDGGKARVVAGEPFRGDTLRVQLEKTRAADHGRLETTGERAELAAGLVLVATGQSKLEKLLGGIEGLSFERGRLLVDADGRTGHARVFAGGDLANGGKEVVNAVAEGKRAARAIHQSLMSPEVRHG